MYLLPFEVQHAYSSAARGMEVEVTFPLGNGGDVRTIAKVDTGAEFCVFENSVAELLGLDFERGEEKTFQAANGSLFKAYGIGVSFTTLGQPLDAILYFSADVKRNVLGRRGWLDRFRLALIDHDCLLYLAPYDA